MGRNQPARAASKAEDVTPLPTAPTGLGDRGAAFWAVTLADFELSGSELELLAECCRLLDEVDDLRAAVERDGVTVKGSTGQPRVHPALGEVRQHRLALGRLLGQLALPDEDGGAVPTPVQSKARRAAAVRWAGHVKDEGA